jgi:hypothetical protein
MSMTKYAVIPEGTDMSGVFDLTVGNRYEILQEGNISNKFGLLFEIIDDAGDKIMALEKRCGFLNSQNWEIQE